MKTLKVIFWNPIVFFIAFCFASLFLCAYFYTTPKHYVGTITSVSSWDGSATLKTKTKLGKDTLLHVVANKRERFVVGQIITVWTGGNLIHGIASTYPQGQNY